MRIPSGWKSFHLRDVTYESRTRAINEKAMGLSVFGVNNQTGLDTNSRYFADKLDRYKIVKPGMFAYNPMRLNIGSIGYCDETLGQGLVSPDYVVFGCKENMLNSKYFSYCIQDHHWKKWVQNAGAGSVRVRIYYKDVSVYSIVLPPLPEQRKIAKILSTWDEAIFQTEQLIIAKQRLKNGLMQLLLTSKIRFSEWTDDWHEMSVAEIGTVLSGGTPDTSNSHYWDGEIAWCTPTDITSLNSVYISKTRRTISKAGLENSSAKILPPNSLLICTRATIGECAINTIPTATNQGFKNIIPNKDFSSEFLYYLIKLNKHKLIQLSSGSTFLELQKTDFEKMRFVMPKLPEQKRIAEALLTCEAEIELQAKKLKALKQQKKGLMQKLLSGQIRVKV